MDSPSDMKLTPEQAVDIMKMVLETYGKFPNLQTSDFAVKQQLDQLLTAANVAITHYAAEVGK